MNEDDVQLALTVIDEWHAVMISPWTPWTEIAYALAQRGRPHSAQHVADIFRVLHGRGLVRSNPGTKQAMLADVCRVPERKAIAS